MAQALSVIQSEFPSVADLSRDSWSALLCVLATGAGRGDTAQPLIASTTWCPSDAALLCAR
ncbi:MAG: hypothetical protein R2867_07690 [Caldilineaceae bacterium]